MADDDEVPQEQPVQKGAAGEQSRGLQNLNANDDGKQQLDPLRVRKAMETLVLELQAHRDSAVQRDREVAAIKASKEDVALIADQFWMDSKAAEKVLKDNGGDLKKALDSLVMGHVPELERKAADLARQGKRQMYS